MPARKSDQPRKSDDPIPDDSAVITVPADESQGSASAPEKAPKDKDKEKDAITIEDLTLPKSIITRLAKGVLPPNTQIQANAILAMSKSATIFINYLASHANENTVNANKKTIAPADVFKALDDIEFSFLKERLQAEFARFNQIQTEKRTNYRQKARAKHDDTDMADSTVASEGGGGAPRAKKARVDPGEAEAEAEEDEEEDAETEEDEEDEEDEDEVHEDGDEHAEEEVEEEEGNQSSQETQDALEEKAARDDRDEALDGDDSD